jgi:hypothetical protein
LYETFHLLEVQQLFQSLVEGSVLTRSLELSTVFPSMVMAAALLSVLPSNLKMVCTAPALLSKWKSLNQSN